MKNNNVTTLIVPPGIRYIGDWKEFYENFPRIPHIMDKQIPGCGFTEWCLTNQDNVVLCSPRNMLIQNKWEQHPDTVYRVVNDSRDYDLNIDKDIDKTGMDRSEEDKARDEGIDVEEFLRKLAEDTAKADNSFREKLRRELKTYQADMARKGLPLKIIVTYDSFRQLKDVLIEFGLLDSFQVIVDEFQSIFVDSRFKSDTELEFVNVLQGIDKVCYLSATPMMRTYLQRIPEFANLPYYELDWESADPGRTRKPNLKVRIIDSIYEPIKRIVREYRKGKFETFREVDKDTGQIRTIESREAMIFVNSVKNIIQIIKKCGIQPEEVNILCSNTPDNQAKFNKGLGSKKYIIGKVPLKDEPRKMFTICTRTVYLGADFYSDNARTFILSDANVDCLAVDISLDLPQILGRQRLEENPWKNSAEFYYKTLRDEETNRKMTREDYERKIEIKIRFSEAALENYQAAPNKDVAVKQLEDRCRDRNYKDDYVGINKHAGRNKLPVMNNLVLIAEQRAFDIQQIDYKDRFTVFSTIDEVFGGKESQTALDVKVALLSIERQTTLVDKLRWLCESNMTPEVRDIVENQMDSKIRGYLSLGRDVIMANGYHITRLNQMLEPEEVIDEEGLKEKVYSEFSVGERLTNAEAKNRLAKVYKDFGLTIKAKASDLKKWFEVARAKVNGDNGLTFTKKK
jgi:hypothetical protein